MSLGVCLVFETKPQMSSYNNFTKIKTNGLPRKTRFLTEARFEILRLSLRLWRRKESVGGLSFWFRVLSGPTRKTRQPSNWQFTNCIKKRDFKQTTPNIGVLYIIGDGFLPRLIIWDCYLEIRPRLVQINRQSFDSLPRKACFEIWPLSLRTEGIVTIVGLSWTCLSPELPSTMAGGGKTVQRSPSSPSTVDRRRGRISEVAKLPPHILASSMSSRPECARRRMVAVSIGNPTTIINQPSCHSNPMRLINQACLPWSKQFCPITHSPENDVQKSNFVPMIICNQPRI